MLVLFLLAGSLALAYYLEPALACPSPLECANFTVQDKVADCNYIAQQQISYDDEQQVLCILWDQSYESSGLYSFNSSSVNATVSLPYRQIDDGSFILAGKIFTLAFVNYLAFSFGKSSLIMRLLGT